MKYYFMDIMTQSLALQQREAFEQNLSQKENSTLTLKMIVALLFMTSGKNTQNYPLKLNHLGEYVFHQRGKKER